eukprot:scaffold26384_cov36-Tisochrysis_lutea.AAC.8
MRRGRLNPYDMREKCAKPPLCYDFSNVATYLSRPEVRQPIPELRLVAIATRRDWAGATGAH